MRLTDTALNWVLPSAVLLVGVLIAMTVRAHARRHGTPSAAKAAKTMTAEGATGAHGRRGEPDEADSSEGLEERLEERRRRKETAYATAAYLLLFCCAAVAAALSFHGLVGFGRQNLGLSGGWEYLVPFGLDGAAMFSAVIAVREASHGDASLGSRLLVWIFASAAAWFNWVHAPRGLGHDGAPQFFAGMSLSAAILFDRALKQTRRAALRDQGLVPRPLPQIRVVRWLRAPRETFGAWSLMLLEGVRSLDEAVDEVRDERRTRDEDRRRQREQERLDRARVKALNRQHRLWSRGPGAVPSAPSTPSGHVDVEIEPVDRPARTPSPGAVSPPPQPSLSAPPQDPSSSAGRSASHSGPADRDDVSPAPQLPVTEVLGAPAHRSRPALQAVADGEPAPQSAAPQSAAPQGGGGSGAASPRLDTLEEKLAEIERQFG